VSQYLQNLYLQNQIWKTNKWKRAFVDIKPLGKSMFLWDKNLWATNLNWDKNLWATNLNLVKLRIFYWISSKLGKSTKFWWSKLNFVMRIYPFYKIIVAFKIVYSVMIKEISY